MKTFKLKNGWIPDRPDQRDIAFAPRASRHQLPELVDLRPAMPPVWDQGDVGSCVGQSVAAAHYCAQKLSGAKLQIMPSRLFIYYNGRAIDGTTKVDAGTYIRSAMKGVAKQGVPDEGFWRYNVLKWAARPSIKAYFNALKNQALTYQRVNNTSLAALQAALAQGLPVVFGAMLYESFYRLVDNAVPMPESIERAEGGHAMLIVGYSNAKQAFLVRNSWGTSWGESGYHWMPYGYITSRTLCDDFWVLSTVEV